MNWKIKIVFGIVYFIGLYLVALISAKDYNKDFPSFLGVEDTQWEAILILWLPVIAALCLNGE